jgi:hypothetical protein
VLTPSCNSLTKTIKLHNPDALSFRSCILSGLSYNHFGFIKFLALAKFSTPYIPFWLSKTSEQLVTYHFPECLFTTSAKLHCSLHKFTLTFTIRPTCIPGKTSYGPCLPVYICFRFQLTSGYLADTVTLRQHSSPKYLYTRICKSSR